MGKAGSTTGETITAKDLPEDWSTVVNGRAIQMNGQCDDSKTITFSIHPAASGTCQWAKGSKTDYTVNFSHVPPPTRSLEKSDQVQPPASRASADTLVIV